MNPFYIKAFNVAVTFIYPALPKHIACPVPPFLNQNPNRQMNMKLLEGIMYHVILHHFMLLGIKISMLWIMEQWVNG